MSLVDALFVVAREEQNHPPQCTRTLCVNLLRKKIIFFSRETVIGLVKQKDGCLSLHGTCRQTCSFYVQRKHLFVKNYAGHISIIVFS